MNGDFYIICCFIHGILSFVIIFDSVVDVATYSGFDAHFKEYVMVLIYSLKKKDYNEIVRIIG